MEPIPPSDGWHDDAGGMIETSAEWLMNEGLIIIYRVLSHQKRGDIYIYIYIYIDVQLFFLSLMIVG